eukprot:CAMPEP_0118673968 /NCGR_PEP_ID=MMETSP0800-20121206/629_1 /TAXON_ID=210618 ORGANISM="Striatella unipunctata, Strain CCMP2910" /NCGR_SAMPLE_ID=MMETSP0800 /ASSEMBLY_ACC=CAM_ASM_000638 /LENGTH=486 /DNA_ID=CAMNT_0006569115 /DNA_START=750 /DNA_END=2210 /DNA_ORIENTATION=-
MTDEPATETEPSRSPTSSQTSSNSTNHPTLPPTPDSGSESKIKIFQLNDVVFTFVHSVRVREELSPASIKAWQDTTQGYIHAYIQEMTQKDITAPVVTYNSEIFDSSKARWLQASKTRRLQVGGIFKRKIHSTIVLVLQGSIDDVNTYLIDSLQKNNKNYIASLNSTEDQTFATLISVDISLGEMEFVVEPKDDTGFMQYALLAIPIVFALVVCCLSCCLVRRCYCSSKKQQQQQQQQQRDPYGAAVGFYNRPQVMSSEIELFENNDAISTLGDPFPMTETASQSQNTFCYDFNRVMKNEPSIHDLISAAQSDSGASGDGPNAGESVPFTFTSSMLNSTTASSEQDEPQRQQRQEQQNVDVEVANQDDNEIASKLPEESSTTSDTTDTSSSLSWRTIDDYRGEGIYEVRAQGALGLELGTADGPPTIASIGESSPLRVAVNQGDVVLAVDGVDARNLSHAALSRMVSQQTFTKAINLVLQRPRQIT